MFLAFGVNQNNYSQTGKNIGLSRKNLWHETINSWHNKIPSNFTVFRLFVLFQLRSVTIHLQNKLKSRVADLKKNTQVHTPLGTLTSKICGQISGRLEDVHVLCFLPLKLIQYKPKWLPSVASERLLLRKREGLPNSRNNRSWGQMCCGESSSKMFLPKPENTSNCLPPHNIYQLSPLSHSPLSHLWCPAKICGAKTWSTPLFGSHHLFLVLSHRFRSCNVLHMRSRRRDWVA